MQKGQTKVNPRVSNQKLTVSQISSSSKPSLTTPRCSLATPVLSPKLQPSPMVSPKSSRTQKAYWNKNGSITVVEVRDDQLQKDLPPYLPDTLQIQSEKDNDIEEITPMKKISEDRKLLLRERFIQKKFLKIEKYHKVPYYGCGCQPISEFLTFFNEKFPQR